MAKHASPLAQRLSELIDFDKRVFFFLLLFIFLLIRYLTNSLILEAIPGYEDLERKGDLMFFHLFNSLNYLWTPFALLWKFTVIAFLFWSIGLMIGYKADFKALWRFALVAEVIFILPELLRLLTYMNPSGNITYQEIQNFEPLSALWLVGPDTLDEKYHYALSVMNVFEILYGVFWVYGYHMISRRSLSESTVVVALAYFLPLFIWLAFYIGAYR
ncbi:sulfate ABC transporter permease [Algoriphagus confluentis]|uniref:Sulfate ABC transporter permease n=1 Tax=Algoriphagus confluentis TaxID=1697556 RepID=A0ABQ6PIF9_9BACT|nr:hypothetical protein Aconfl_03660 [Algoriphagus confluentis]